MSPSPDPMAPDPLADPSAPELVALIPELRRLSRRLRRDPAAAEDLVQEALLRVWSRIRAGDGHIEDLKPYLITAARNLARRPGRVGVSLSDVPEPAAAPATPGRLALRDVAAALSRLPREDVRLILRHAAKGESYADIAASDGVALGTVMSRLARARARLRARCGLPESGSVARLLIGLDAP